MAALMGHWKGLRSAPTVDAVEINLTIRDTRAHLVIQSPEQPAETFIDNEGEIEVSGEYLRSPALACGAVHHFSVNNGVLEVFVSGEPPVKLGRTDSQRP